MKEALEWLKSFKIHAPDFACNMDNSSGGPSAAGKELHMIPNHPTSLDIDSTEYRLPLALYDRPIAQYTSPINFWHSLVHPKTETKIIRNADNTKQQPPPDWQTDEDWGDNYQTGNTNIKQTSNNWKRKLTGK